MSLMYKGCHEFCYPSRWVVIWITTSADYFSQSEWKRAWLKHPSISLLKIWEFWNEIGKKKASCSIILHCCLSGDSVGVIQWKTRSTNMSLKLKFNVASNKSSTHCTVGKPLDGDGCPPVSERTWEAQRVVMMLMDFKVCLSPGRSRRQPGLCCAI